MWWCCGKKGENTPGCNFSKHEMKNDEEDEDEVLSTQNQKTTLHKCNCCKEMGHKTEDCPRDPNIKTVAKGRVEIAEENLRISKLRDFRKLFADTAITTTHFLKKCIKV